MSTFGPRIIPSGKEEEVAESVPNHKDLIKRLERQIEELKKFVHGFAHTRRWGFQHSQLHCREVSHHERPKNREDAKRGLA